MFIVKELVPLSFVKHKFSKILFLKQNPWLNFPSRQKFIRHDLLPRIAKMTKEMFVSPSLVSYNTCIVRFDLWMFEGRC
jgi:hypothetical protein